MAEDLKDSGTVTAMSVIGLVFGLIGMLGSFIPCIGALAFYIGIPAAIISAIALGIAYSQKAKNTFAIVALTISLIGVVISGWQFFSIMGAGIEAKKELERMSRPVMPAPTAAVPAPAPGPQIEQLSPTSSAGNKAEARKLFYDAYSPLIKDWKKQGVVRNDSKWIKKEILLPRGTSNFVQVEIKQYNMFRFDHNKKLMYTDCGNTRLVKSSAISPKGVYGPERLKTGDLNNGGWRTAYADDPGDSCVQYTFEPFYEDTKLYLYLPKDFQDDFKITLKNAQLVN